MSPIDLIKDIGVVTSATIGVITLVSTIVKPIRKSLLKCIRKIADVDSINTEIKGLKDEFKETHGAITEAIDLLRDENAKQTEVLSKLNSDVHKANLANKAALGNSIKHIYYVYADTKKLPVHEIEALYLLHDAYKDEGGNSFVDVFFYLFIY